MKAQLISTIVDKDEKINLKYYNFYVKGIGRLKTKKDILQALELNITVYKQFKKKYKHEF